MAAVNKWSCNSSAVLDVNMYHARGLWEKCPFWNIVLVCLDSTGIWIWTGYELHDGNEWNGEKVGVAWEINYNSSKDICEEWHAEHLNANLDF